MAESYRKMINSSIQLKNLGKSDYFDDEFFYNANRYLVSGSYQNNVSARWLNVRLAFVNSVFLFTCLFVPLVALNYLGSSFTVKDLWKLSLGFAWVNKTISMVSKLGGSLQSINVDTITLENSYEWIEHEEVDLKKDQVLSNFDKNSNNTAIDFLNVNIFDNVGISILKNLSFKIKDNARVGFVGNYSDGLYEIPSILLG